jgi:glycosyltransferase involved in cell wall biosynthesis
MSFEDLLNKTLIVVPAYNEEESIVTTINNLIALYPKCNYLIVNDGSTDNTHRICVENGFSILDLPLNLGLTGAFQAGMKYADQKGYEYVLQFDADGQHLPEYIAAILEAASGHDIVIGSRFLSEKKPLSMRMLGSAFISGAIRLTTGVKIKDPTSGMRLFGHKALKTFVSDKNSGPEPDTVSYLIKKGATVTEVPVKMVERALGTSLYVNPKSAILYMLRMAISILAVQPLRK